MLKIKFAVRKKVRVFRDEEEIGIGTVDEIKSSDATHSIRITDLELHPGSTLEFQYVPKRSGWKMVFKTFNSENGPTYQFEPMPAD